MLSEAKLRTSRLEQRMEECGIEVALITAEDSIAYLAGFWGYLGVEFGRPTMLVVRPGHEPVVITPLMEQEMVAAMTWVTDIRVWEDAGPRSWGRVLGEALGGDLQSVHVEKRRLPAIIRGWLDEQDLKLEDISPLLDELRMIKSELEIDVMKKAGTIAGAMMKAAHTSLKVGAREYESALAVIDAGTRAAAGFLTDKGWERFVSPMIHNLQILQSGPDTSMVHRRASVRQYQQGDPVYFCFCNMVQFKQYKLGFDRMFHIGGVDAKAEHVQQAAIDAQRRALEAIRPGVRAEEVAAAANEVYRERGYETGYRTGRAIGTASLEAPELKAGDKTILQPGMTFAVDGGISIDRECGGRIGDSIVVTEEGFEFLTNYPREILLVE
ncbi:Xaa-Pro peptidase family protein [Fodinicurvata sp. CAU 1616]|uniref:Xaa-Pro peptidase family protein n=2 Tax=Aquibaculum arenosum TaxID=3032591 RepID=A0ABT5YPI9_9PROT|nr:Xaa-Pro peptidase family protein [Fodinicurvata sp. CAU 1616]